MKDYYSILQISRTSSSIEIKSAYRNLSKKYHPDVNKKINASSMFIEIKEAYEVLIDENRRNQYNQMLDLSTNKKHQNINIIPSILFFYCDKSEFLPGDIVTFTWETSDADIVELRPFGKVTNTGTKKIRITEANKNLLIELFCFNSISKNYVFSQIILKKSEYINNQYTSQVFQETFLNKNESNDLIKNNPHVDRRNFEKEKLLSIFGRIGQQTYIKRIMFFSFIYLVFMIYFVSNNLLNSFFCLILNTIYYTLTSIQSVKRFHDFNSNGKLSFLSAIPFLNLLQFVYLFRQKGDLEINNYGLSNENESKVSLINFRKKINQKVASLTKIERFTIATVLFNILAILFLLSIPKYQVLTPIENIYKQQFKVGQRVEDHYFIQTNIQDFEISETMRNLILKYNIKEINLGINPINDKVSFLRLKENDYQITHYVSIINFNNPLTIVYLIFLMFQYFVFFIDKQMKYEKKYNSLLYFIATVNIAYFFFYIL